jgi:hypothetical protein
MTTPADDERELFSWKEIAAHLGVSVRTAQLWERQRGLPVRRLPGGARGRVAAWLHELEDWKRSALELPEPEAQPEPSPAPPQPTVSRRRWLWAAGALGLSAAVPAYFLRRSTPRPASFRVEGSSLVVLDETGSELWTHQFEFRLIASLTPVPYHNPAAHIGDVDGDGGSEVLFAKRPLETGRHPSSLLCFSDTGQIKWEFVPGRTVATSRQTFPPPYVVRDFAFGNLGAGHGRGIVVSATHARGYPAQLSLLSPDGKVRGEYWHSGHLGAVRIGDLDGDGRIEIGASGTNNAEAQATFVLLDPARIAGASVESVPDYQLLGFAPAREKRRVLFPRSCVNRVNYPRNFATQASLQGDTLTVEVIEAFGEANWGPVYYHFGKNLELKGIEGSEGYRLAHESYEKRGLLDHPFSPAELEAYPAAVRFLPERP